MNPVGRARGRRRSGKRVRWSATRDNGPENAAPSCWLPPARRKTRPLARHARARFGEAIASLRGPNGSASTIGPARPCARLWFRRAVRRGSASSFSNGSCAGSQCSRTWRSLCPAVPSRRSLPIAASASSPPTMRRNTSSIDPASTLRLTSTGWPVESEWSSRSSRAPRGREPAGFAAPDQAVEEAVRMTCGRPSFMPNGS